MSNNTSYNDPSKFQLPSLDGLGVKGFEEQKKEEDVQ